jgi:Fic/DOC family
VPERDIEFDHHPEVVENAKGIRRLELLGAKEIFADAEARRGYFATLDDQRFTKILGYVNSVTRGESINYAFGDSQALNLKTPPPESKTPLLERTFGTVRTILGRELLDNETALRRAGLTIGGAINYIHPYNNGNGRTGRVMHYLMEFGSERGDQAFNDELYAIIAKIPAYDIHSGLPIDNTPPPELTRALDAAARDRNPDNWTDLDERAQAAARVAVFLDMMQSNIAVPIQKNYNRNYQSPISDGPRNWTIVPAGTEDGLALYEREYLARSAVPHYQPHDLPADTVRVTARRPDSNPEVTADKDTESDGYRFAFDVIDNL